MTNNSEVNTDEELQVFASKLLEHALMPCGRPFDNCTYDCTDDCTADLNPTLEFPLHYQ